MVQCKHIKTGKLRTFNDVQWKLLGAPSKEGDKNGWKPIVAQETTAQTQTSAQKPLPLTGDKKKSADAEDATYQLHKERFAILLAIDERFKESDLGTMPEAKFNELVETAKVAKAHEAEIAEKKLSENSEITEEVKQAFANACAEKKLSKGIIKDYFDKPEVNVTYDNKANFPALVTQLGEYFGWDLDKLNANF